MTDASRERARDAKGTLDWFKRNADPRNPKAFIHIDPAYFAAECAAAIMNGTLAFAEQAPPAGEGDMNIANQAVEANLNAIGEPKWSSAQGYACALEAVRLTRSSPKPVSGDEVERIWRDGWSECKGRLTDDEAFCLTADVEEDAWLDSASRLAALSMPAEEGE